ncbi:MAG: adenylate cyclase [Acholeplasmataceae bacterium]|jgi:class 3 adenylate cyclase
MGYDYKQRKNVIFGILDSPAEISNKASISELEKEDGGSLTFSNGIRTQIGSIFIDIEKSTELFSKDKSEDTTVARIIRVFTSEIIQILNDTELYRKIGIRGDCVFAVYDVKNEEDAVEIYNMAVYINTLKKMINKIFKGRNIKTINYGIGLGLSTDLVIKAGKKKVINDLVFVGDAVINAANLSSKAGRTKTAVKGIAMDTNFYNKIYKIEKEKYPNFDTWFTPKWDNGIEYYHGSVINTNFDKWIDNEL